jgi:hypothetical protein
MLKKLLYMLSLIIVICWPNSGYAESLEKILHKIKAEKQSIDDKKKLLIIAEQSQDNMEIKILRDELDEHALNLILLETDVEIRRSAVNAKTHTPFDIPAVKSVKQPQPDSSEQAKPEKSQQPVWWDTYSRNSFSVY